MKYLSVVMILALTMIVTKHEGHAKSLERDISGQYGIRMSGNAIMKPPKGLRLPGAVIGSDVGPPAGGLRMSDGAMVAEEQGRGGPRGGIRKGLRDGNNPIQGSDVGFSAGGLRMSDGAMVAEEQGGGGPRGGIRKVMESNGLRDGNSPIQK